MRNSEIIRVKDGKFQSDGKKDDKTHDLVISSFTLHYEYVSQR